MSRTKHAAKVKTDSDQPSLWAGKPILKQRNLATFGETYSAEAANILNQIGFAIQLEKGTFKTQPWPGVSNPKEYEREKVCQHEEAWRILSEAFWNAVETRKGTIFRQMAHVLEHAENPIQPKREAFLKVVNLCEVQKRTLPTPAQMKKLMDVYLKPFRMTANFTDIRRFETYAGVKLPRS
jgi:hypothetical protein